MTLESLTAQEVASLFCYQITIALNKPEIPYATATSDKILLSKQAAVSFAQNAIEQVWLNNTTEKISQRGKTAIARLSIQNVARVWDADSAGRKLIAQQQQQQLLPNLQLNPLDVTPAQQTWVDIIRPVLVRMIQHADRIATVLCSVLCDAINVYELELHNDDMVKSSLFLMQYAMDLPLWQPEYLQQAILTKFETIRNLPRNTWATELGVYRIGLNNYDNKYQSEFTNILNKKAAAVAAAAGGGVESNPSDDEVDLLLALSRQSAESDGGGHDAPSSSDEVDLLPAVGRQGDEFGAPPSSARPRKRARTKITRRITPAHERDYHRLHWNGGGRDTPFSEEDEHAADTAAGKAALVAHVCKLNLNL